jgi:hypothetical protein
MKQPTRAEIEEMMDSNRPSIYTEEEGEALSQVMYELIYPGI